MAQITDVYEAPRGCGDRVAGGMYLRASGLWGECGKLPLQLSECPACGQGVKVTRGLSKINPQKLFGGLDCHNSAAACVNCGLSDRHLKKVGYLMGIGAKFYKTPGAFISEALAVGVSKRIAQIPRDLVVGETPVYLAHPKVFKDLVEMEASEIELDDDDPEPLDPFEDPEAPRLVARDLPGVVAVFVPTHIEYVVSGSETEAQLDALEKRGLTLIRVHKLEDKPEHA